MTWFECNPQDQTLMAQPTVSTASGSVANFTTDMTENLVEVECEIVYQQASGTPSPSNPLPIKIYNSLNLAHIGNTDKLTYLQGLLDGTYGFVDLSSLSWSYQTSGERFVSAGIASLVKAPASNDDIANVACSILTTTYANNTTVGGLDNSIAITSTSKNIVVKATSAGTTQVGIVAYLSGCGFIYELATPTTPTITKAEFNALLTAFGIDGSLYNIPFGQTVAKGKLNVTTGVLEITHGVVDMGNLTWNYRSANTVFYTDLIPDCKVDNQSCACSYYEYDSNSNDSTVAKIAQNLSNLQMACFTNQEQFVVKDTNYTDVPTFTSAVSGQTLVYELATPQTIQLSAQTITALLNENNIWCDTNGDTSVKFILSVGEYVNQNT